MLLILLKVSFVPASIGVKETSKPLSFAMQPVPLVNVLDDLILNSAIEPVVRAEAMLQVVEPFAFVLLVFSEPVHNPGSAFLVIKPFAFVDVA